jgi:hypothetical protein
MGNGLAVKAQYGKDDDASTDFTAAGVSKKFDKKTEVYGLYATGDMKQGAGSSAIALGLIQKF